MSSTWAIVNHAKREKVWIGQGTREKMEGFYTGEPATRILVWAGRAADRMRP